MMKQSLWALAAAALFSVMAAFVKLCSDVHGPIEMVFYRSLFGVLVISLFVFRNRATLTLKTPRATSSVPSSARSRSCSGSSRSERCTSGPT